MRYAVSRIGLSSVFKIGFVVSAFTGLILAFFYALLFLLLSQLNADFFGVGREAWIPHGLRLGGLAIFFLGISAALVNAVVSAAILTVAAALYNVLASWIGGITIDLRSTEPSPYAMHPLPPVPTFTPPPTPSSEPPSPYAPPPAPPAPPVQPEA